MKQNFSKKNETVGIVIEKISRIALRKVLSEEEISNYERQLEDKMVDLKNHQLLFEDGKFDNHNNDMRLLEETKIKIEYENINKDYFALKIFSENKEYIIEVSSVDFDKYSEKQEVNLIYKKNLLGKKTNFELI